MAAVHVAVNLFLAAILPGWLLLRALGWPRSRPERLLLIGPASIALIALCAAVLGTVDRALTTSGIVSIDVVLAVVAWARRGALAGEEQLPWHVLALGAIPGLALLALAVQAAGGLVPPPSEDSIVHAQVVRWFLDGRAAPGYLPDRLDALLTPETRYGWHVFAAALARGTGIDPARATTLATWPVIAMLPGGVMLLARRAGLGWRTAWLAGCAALGVGIVPFRILALGQAPLLTGAYVVAPAAAVAVIDAVEMRRQGACIAAVVLAAGVVYVHPSDLPTLALLAATLAVARWALLRRPSRREALALGVSAAAFVAMATPWLRYRALPMATARLGVPTGGGAVQSEHFLTARHLEGFVSDVLGSLTTTVHDYALPALALVALLVAWRRPAVRAFAALGVVLLALQVDAWGWQWPARLLVRVYPWSATERLLYMDWFVLAPLAAVAVATLIDRLVATGRRPHLSPSLSAATMVLAAIPVIGLAPAMLTHAENYQVALTPADEQVLQRLDGIVPAGEPILTDGTADGGAWITVLTGNQTLLDKDWVYSSAAPEVVAALRGLCSAGAAQRLEHLGVRWVYLGARVATADPSADRSCPQGTSELSHVRLSGVDEAGPLLFRAEVASTPLR